MDVSMHLVGGGIEWYIHASFGVWESTLSERR